MDSSRRSRTRSGRRGNRSEVVVVETLLVPSALVQYGMTIPYQLLIHKQLIKNRFNELKQACSIYFSIWSKDSEFRVNSQFSQIFKFLISLATFRGIPVVTRG